MVVLDNAVDAGLISEPGDAGGALPSGRRRRPDYRRLYERERARADAAESRCEELRRSDAEARSRAGTLKWQLEQCHAKRKAVEEELREVRRTAKDSLSLKSEVARLERLLAEAGVESGKRSTMTSLRMEVVELRKAKSEVKDLKAERKAHARVVRELESRLRDERKESEELGWCLRASHKEIERLNTRHRQEMDRRHEDIERLREWGWGIADGRREECRAECRRHERRHASMLRKLEARDEKIKRLEERTGRLRSGMARATELARSLRGKNAAFRAEIRALESENRKLAARAESLEADNERFRSSRAVLSKRTYGKKSERRKRPGTGRNRGQQPGSEGHGRTVRPGLRERKERIDPPSSARTCPDCGEPYVANGERHTTMFEVHVRAHKRKVARSRWRRTCECTGSPREAIAPPVARLFENTPYGISVWLCFLFERYACGRPLHRVAAWLGDMGLPISSGTLADSMQRLAPLFLPLAAEILAHQNRAVLRHADETTWRVHEYRRNGGSGKAWLWVSVSLDAVYFHIDPSRSAGVAKRLFRVGAGILYLVCDRYSAYKSLALALPGKVVLCWCWAHQRRTFIDCAAGHVRLRRWCERWIERIAEIYRLNDARMKHYRSCRKKQTAAFNAAQRELEAAVCRLFADAGAELDGLSDKARRSGALRSLLNHQEGLTVFVERPQVPMDNNTGERAIRRMVIERRLSFGSDSEQGAEFTAAMYSLVDTLAMNGIDVRRWLAEWLAACADNGGKPPDDLEPWLPWSMGKARRRALAAPP